MPLCPCAGLDWSGTDMTKEHHPDCETNKVTAKWMPASEASRELIITFGNANKSKNILDVTLTAGDGCAPWIYPAQKPESDITATQFNPFHHTVEFTHCGVKTSLTFHTPSWEAACSVCNEVLFSRKDEI